MHSPETGGPEMLIELAYRLIVEETPFIQNIRNNVITLITPVIEVDGREKQVDTYYFNKTRAQGDARLPLMYWGKYVQHDNNRDGMGQFLELTLPRPVARRRTQLRAGLDEFKDALRSDHAGVSPCLCLGRGCERQGIRGRQPVAPLRRPGARIGNSPP